jgi:hypothetical protein
MMCVYVYHLPIRNRNVDQYHISKSLIRTPEDSLTYLVLDEMYTNYDTPGLAQTHVSTEQHEQSPVTTLFSLLFTSRM